MLNRPQQQIRLGFSKITFFLSGSLQYIQEKSGVSKDYPTGHKKGKRIHSAEPNRQKRIARLKDTNL